MSHLVPCPACARHVRTTEARCPFCAVALDLAGTPPPLLPTERLGRSATLGFQSLVRTGMLGAAAASALVACTESNAVAIYGAPGGGGDYSVGGSAGTGGTSAGTGGGGSGGTAGGSAEGGAAGESEGGAAGN